MAEFRKITDVLQEDTVELTEGEYLVSHTMEDGYTGVHQGQYRYKIEKDGAGLKVVPVVTAEDGKEFKALSGEPIIVQDKGKVTYICNTRNQPYEDVEVFTEEVKEGEEHRFMLIAFTEFVKDEFALGVNQFMVETPSYTGKEKTEDTEQGKDQEDGK